MVNLVTSDKLSEWLESYCEDMLNVPSTFTQTTVWADLGERKTYHSHTFKLTKLEKPIYRVLYWIIFYDLNTC